MSDLTLTDVGHVSCGVAYAFDMCLTDTVKLDNKERFDKEQIGMKEPFPVTNLPFTP